MLTLTCIPVKVSDSRYRRDFRAVRRALGVRQYDVAEAICVSLAAVSRWERGEPSIGHVKARAAARWLAEQAEAR